MLTPEVIEVPTPGRDLPLGFIVEITGAQRYVSSNASVFYVFSARLSGVGKDPKNGFLSFIFIL
jgi:hypothetical protein